MRLTFKDRIEWVHIESPSEEDFALIEKTFPLPEDIREALRMPLLRPRFLAENSFRYAVLHIPVYNARERHPHAVEIDILATATTVVTIAFGAVPVIEEVLRQMMPEGDAPAKGRRRKREDAAAHGFTKQLLGRSTDHLLWELGSRLLEFTHRQLDHIQSKIDHIEHKIIDGKGRKDLLEEAAVLRGDILDIRRTAKPGRLVFEGFAQSGDHHWRALVAEHDRTAERIESLKESIETIYDTFAALISIRTGEIMRTLTIIATITFPLTLFTSLFSINAAHTPLVEMPYGFWIIAGIVGLASLAMLAIFKAREWF